jgi:hypothetical protein
MISKNASWQKNIYAIVILFSLLNIILLHYIYPTLYQQNPVSKTIAIVKQSPVIISYQTFNPGYNFYLDKNVRKFSSLDSLNIQLNQNPDAIVISRKNFLDSLKSLNLEVIAEHKDIFELPTTIILKRNAKP